MSAEDTAIRSQMLSTLARKSWWIAEKSNVVVIDRIVILQGVFHARPDPGAVRGATVTVPGVRGLQDCRVRAAEWQFMT
jgi:osmotically-inducible protein OsmY